MTNEHLQFTQKRELFSFGQYIALSVAHGGNGIPVLAVPVYKYIATGKFDQFCISPESIPNGDVKFAVKSVSSCSKLCLCANAQARHTVVMCVCVCVCVRVRDFICLYSHVFLDFNSWICKLKLRFWFGLVLLTLKTIAVECHCSFFRLVCSKCYST